MLKKLNNYCGKAMNGKSFSLYSAEDDPIVLRVSKSGRIFRQLVRVGLEPNLTEDELIVVQSVPGLAQCHGIMVISPSFICDSYHGELKLVMANLGDEVYTIYPGNKIAEVKILNV